MKVDPNAPASAYFSPECGTSHGLTVRAHFAGMFVQGIIASGATQQASENGADSLFIREVVAKAGVLMADALIAELNK